MASLDKKLSARHGAHHPEFVSPALMAAVAAPLKNFVAGSFAGACECIVGHPLDTIKVRVQTQALSSAQSVGAASAPSVAQPPFTTPLGCLVQTVRNDGFLSLYRGAAPRVCQGGISGAVLFGVNGNLRKLLGADQTKPFSLPMIAAGMGTGACEALIYCPLELVKTRMQIQYGRYAGKGVAEVAREVVAEKGVRRGLYRGMTPTLAREIFGNIVYFGTYFFMKTHLAEHEAFRDASTGEISKGGIVVAGGTAGSVYWFAVHPVDTVKSVLQADSLTQPRYRGPVDCALQVLREQGLRGIYRGLSPSLLRAFPSNAAAFLSYEWMMERLE